MIAKKKFKAEFNEESFEALVKDSLKAREIPDKPLLGFAIYDKDDFTPTIITHELQAGENECALPYNMSFRGNFNAINSFITSFKLKSPAEKSAMEINILDLAIPKGFSTHTTAIPIAEGNRIVNIVIFTYDNSNRESLAKVNLALKSFEDENQNYEKLRDYFPDLELSEIEQRDFLFKALNSLLDNPKRPSLNYIWKRGLIVSYIKRLEKAFSQDEVGILFRGLKVRSAMLTMDADIVELLEEITGENTSYTLDYLKTYQGNDEADRLKRIQDWQFSYLNNKNKKR